MPRNKVTQHLTVEHHGVVLLSECLPPDLLMLLQLSVLMSHAVQLLRVMLQASEEQQGLRPSDLKSSVLKDVVKAKQRAKPDINTSIYRVQKAKGPNPMSMKKKTKTKQPAATSASSDKPKKPARKRRKAAPSESTVE